MGAIEKDGRSLEEHGELQRDKTREVESERGKSVKWEGKQGRRV